MNRPGRAVLAAAFALPVLAVATVDPGAWSPFGPAKWLAVSAVAWVLVLLVTIDGEGPAVPRRLGVPLAGLVLWLAVAAARGADPVAAWLGSGERFFGWCTWVLCAALAVVGVRLAGTGARRSAVAGCAASTVVLALWCLVELLGWEPVSVDADTERLLGPFGSAAYTASALVLLVPVAVGFGLAHWHAARARAAIVLAASAVGAVALVATGTRGAWLAVALTLLVTALARVRRRPSWRVLAAGAAVVAGVVALAAAATPVGTRASNLWADGPGGGLSRLDEYAVAVDVMADHPLAGVGPEGYRMAATEHIDDDYAIGYGREVLTDRAHSGPLDLAAIGGLPALGLWLAAVAALAPHVWRALRRGTPEEAGVAFGLIAYLAAQLVLFPIAVLDPIAWLLAGLLVVPAGGEEHSPGRWSWTTVGVVAATGALVASVLIAGAQVLADRQAQRSLDATNPTVARAAAERARSLRPDLPRYRLLAARVHEGAGRFDLALDEVRDGLDWSPSDPLLRLEEGEVLIALAGRDLSLDRAAEAVDVLTDLVGDDPSNPAVFDALGRARAAAGEVDGAVSAFERAAALEPDSADPLVSAARVLDAAGDRPGALAALRRALARQPGDPAANELFDQLNR